MKLVSPHLENEHLVGMLHQMDAVDSPEKVGPEKFFSLGPMKAGDVVFFPGSKIHYGRTSSPDTSSSVMFLDFYLCTDVTCKCSQSTEYQPDVVQAKALTQSYFSSGFMKAMSDWVDQWSFTRYPSTKDSIRTLIRKWEKSVERVGGDVEAGHIMFLIENGHAFCDAFGINAEAKPDFIFGDSSGEGFETMDYISMLAKLESLQV